jgi:hypothetical protein
LKLATIPPREHQTGKPEKGETGGGRTFRVILRDLDSGLYYQGNCQWTRNQKQALDLRHTQNALKLAANFRLKAAEVVLAPSALPYVATERFRYPWWQN